MSSLSPADKLVMQASRDRTVRHDIISKTGDEAVQTLDDLHNWLQRSASKQPLRRCVVHLLRRLSENTGCWPRRLTLSNVSSDSNFRGPMDANGGSGAVYRATYQSKQVAAKRLLLTANQQKYLYRELSTWCALRNDYILPLLGTFPDPRDGNIHYMISPWMTHGNLKQFVNGDGYNPKLHRRRLAQEIAQGLAYLHLHDVTHGDICAENILLDDEPPHAKIGDFGLALLGENTWSLGYSTTGQHQGHVGYLPPEVLMNKTARRRKPVDVFAYAGVCYVLCTGKRPYEREGYSDPVLANYILNSHRPVKPEAEQCRGKDTPSIRFWGLITMCWAQVASDRLTMPNVLAYFDCFPCSPDSPMFAVKASCSRTGKATGDYRLDFRKDDILKIHSEINPDVWFASTAGEDFGAVKKNHVRYFPLFSGIVICQANPDDRGAIAGGLNLNPGTEVQVLHVEASSWFVKTLDTPKKPGFEAQMGKFGLVQQKNITPLWPTNDLTKQWLPATVIFNRTADPKKSELTLRAGTQVEVLEMSGLVEANWRLARCLGAGNEYAYGVVPTHYLRVW